MPARIDNESQVQIHGEPDWEGLYAYVGSVRLREPVSLWGSQRRCFDVYVFKLSNGIWNSLAAFKRRRNRRSADRVYVWEENLIGDSYAVLRAKMADLKTRYFRGD